MLLKDANSDAIETINISSGSSTESPPDQSADQSVDQSQSTTQARDPVSHLYTNINKNVFKTSNRLLDDIKADLLLISDTSESNELRSGILKLIPIKYSGKIESTKYNPFDIYIMDQELSFAPTIEHRHSKANPRDRVTIIRAVLYNNSEASLSKCKVYHVKIIVKVKEIVADKTVSKNEYYLVNNDQLKHEDIVDLLENKSLDGVEDAELAQSALPRIVDEATYVCSATNKILRIEISEPEFDFEDLHDFEIGPINVRYNKALTSFPGLSPSVPSPAQCLHTLFKALKGPLSLNEGDDTKTIDIDNKPLNSRINPALLVKRLQFQITDTSFIPPNISDSAHDVRAAVIKESYIRKSLEVCLLGIKSYSGTSENPFQGMVSFVKDLGTIFHQLGDNGSIRHHEYIKSASFINLSVYPFYSDDLIKSCYNTMTYIDPTNKGRYFDSLKDVSVALSTIKLKKFVSQLTALGFIGQREIESAYKTLLETVPEDESAVEDDVLLSMYHAESKAHPLDTKLRSSLELLAKHRNSAKLRKFLKYEPLRISEAYRLLEIEPHVDDDIVSTAFMIKTTDEVSRTQLFNRAFITIAIERRSYRLLDKVEKDFPDIFEPMSFEEACQCLGLDENADDSQAISVFQMNLSDITKTRSALRTFGEHKKSKLINSFLETGIIDHSLLPASSWPVGLNNIGNTCYLNSLLQYYFSIKPLRNAILNFNDVYSGEEIYQNRRIGGRLVGDEEVERSFQFTYHLRDLFYAQIHSGVRCITPKKELAYLAFLPSVTAVEFEDPNLITTVNPFADSNAPPNSKESSDLIKLDEDVDIIDQPPPVPSEVEADLIDIDRSDDEFILVDEDARSGNSPAKSYLSDPMLLDTPTSKEEQMPSKIKEAKVAKIKETEMETAYEIGRQQDVTECIGNVLSQIEAALKPEGFEEEDQEQKDLVKSLFFGKTVQHLSDVNDPSVKREKVDSFSNLFVNITDKPRNIYDAFDLVFKSEELPMDAGVFRRSERITKLPIILQVQIQRVYFDRETLRVYKSTEPLVFPETLYMDRYFDTSDPQILTKREEVNNWKQEIAQLKQRREKLLSTDRHNITFRDSLKATKEWLENNGLGKPETLKTLERQVTIIDTELSSIYQKIESLENKIDHQFDSFTKHGYSIFAIFIHRGEANFGHYWIYIKDSAGEIYRKYNDEIVSEVSKEEVFNFQPTNTATPYFLGYVKQGHEHEIEPLCRVISEVVDTD